MLIIKACKHTYNVSLLPPIDSDDPQFCVYDRPLQHCNYCATFLGGGLHSHGQCVSKSSGSTWYSVGCSLQGFYSQGCCR